MRADIDTAPVSALDVAAQPLPLAVIRVHGSQRQMGAQHGQALRQLGGWQRTLAYYPQMAERMLRGSAIRPQDRALPTLARPLLGALSRQLLAHRPAALRARSEAFMTALGLDPQQARHILTMDLFQNAVGLAGRHTLGPFADPWIRRGVPACSTLMAWDSITEGGRLLHGRNFDFPGVGVWDIAPAVVFCSPDEGLRYGFATARGADVAAITAFNEAGLTVTPHTRLHRDVAFDGASIVDLCHEIAMQARTIAEAEAIVRRRRVASTWGLSVSSAPEHRAAVIECTAARVGITHPSGDEPWITCTNHYLDPALRDGELAPAPGWTWHTHSRKKRLEQAARQALAGEPLTASALFGWLGDRRDADCPEVERVAGGVLAQATGVQTTVADPDRQTLHVSVGRTPSGRGAMASVPWRWTAHAEAEEVVTADPTSHAPSSRYDGGEASAALRHYLRAGQLEAQGGNPHEVGWHLIAAAELEPLDSTLQLLGAAAQMRQGHWAAARSRLEQASAREPSPFAKGRLHLWASRVAAVQGEPAAAHAHRDALHALRHPLLAPLKGMAEADRVQPHAESKLRAVPLHTLLGDIG